MSIQNNVLSFANRDGIMTQQLKLVRNAQNMWLIVQSASMRHTASNAKWVFTSTRRPNSAHSATQCKAVQSAQCTTYAHPAPKVTL